VILPDPARYATAALSLPRAQGDERIEYHPVDLQALAARALARAKCPLRRNADLIDAGLPWRRLDAFDQLRHLPFECVGVSLTYSSATRPKFLFALGDESVNVICICWSRPLCGSL
jgi:hypothetical protein